MSALVVYAVMIRTWPGGSVKGQERTQQIKWSGIAFLLPRDLDSRRW